MDAFFLLADWRPPSPIFVNIAQLSTPAERTILRLRLLQIHGP